MIDVYQYLISKKFLSTFLLPHKQHEKLKSRHYVSIKATVDGFVKEDLKKSCSEICYNKAVQCLKCDQRW